MLALVILFLQFLSLSPHQAPASTPRHGIIYSVMGSGPGLGDTGVFHSMWPDSMESHWYNVSSLSAKGYGDTLFAGTVSSGLWRSSNGGKSWTPDGPPLDPNDGLEDQEIHGIVADGSNIFLATFWHGFQKSLNNGNTWSLDTIGLPSPIYGTSLLKTDKGTLILTSWDNGGIYRSTNDGSSWTCSNTGFRFSGDQWKSAAITASCFNKKSKSIFISTGEVPDPWNWPNEHLVGDGLFRSTDDGISWTDVGFDSVFTHAVVSDDSGNVFAGTSEGIFVSKDNGSTWNMIPNPSSQKAVWTLLADSRVGLVVAYDDHGISTDNGGVYVTQDLGKHWTYLGMLNRGKILWSLALDDSLYLYVGDPVSVWKSSAPLPGIITDVENVPSTTVSTFRLSQNYPNPFNPTTTIQFSVPKRTFVTLKIYNILGQEIKTLVKGEMNQGSHEVTFAAGSLPSGTYLYRLETSSGFSITKKMVLLK